MTPRASTFIAALALAAGCGVSLSAQAQGSPHVTLYGLIDVSVGRSQAPGGSATQGVDSGKMSTSHFGLRGAEDLGSGLKGVFALESFMLNDTGAAGRFSGDAFWARNAYVGLEGGFGSLLMGRNTTALFVQTLLFNAFGDSFGFSPAIRHYFTSGTATGDTGWNDSLRYSSPRWGGLSLGLHLAAGEGNGGRNAGVNLGYGAGPLALGLAWQQVKKGAAVADTDTWQLAVSYDFGSFKLMGQYGQVDNDSSGVQYDIVGLGATVKMGEPGVLRLQWGQIDPSAGAKRSTLALGYGHFLSKRTELYGAAMNDKLSGVGSGNSYSVGVRHRF